MTTFEQNLLTMYGRKGQEWLDRLPALTHQISQAWDLSDLHPIAIMTYNYVLAGFQKEKPVILKLSIDADRLSKEIQALKILTRMPFS